MAWNTAWDELFKTHRWGRYPPEEVVRFVARHFYSVPKRQDIRILDIGCGPGTNLWFIAREGFSAFGLDGSNVALEIAKERLTEEHVAAHLVQGDAVCLPYPDAYFDGILDIECLYANTKRDSKTIVAEIYRTLKPGGYLFSKTFMTTSYGDGGGNAISGEPHTFSEIQNNNLHTGRGIVRFTAEDEIQEIYGIFHHIEYDCVVRSDYNRQYEIKEWLISCCK